MVRITLEAKNFMIKFGISFSTWIREFTKILGVFSGLETPPVAKKLSGLR